LEFNDLYWSMIVALALYRGHQSREVQLSRAYASIAGAVRLGRIGGNFYKELGKDLHLAAPMSAVSNLRSRVEPFPQALASEPLAGRVRDLSRVPVATGTGCA
jgi:hypothetical protein